MIVIFGGGGQVAQELSRICTETGVGARAFTRAEADVADPDAVARAIATAKADIVVNAAAYTNVDRAETEIGEAMRSNATGPAVLARICADSGLPLIQLSTDYVFDGTKRGAYVETDATAQLGAYGRTKLAGEDAIRACQPEHIILRTSWVFGAFGHNMLKTVLRLARDRDELRFVADQHGCPTASVDIATAILRVVPRLAARDDLWGTYHFAGGRHDLVRTSPAARRIRRPNLPGDVPGWFRSPQPTTRRRLADRPIPCSTRGASHASSASGRAPGKSASTKRCGSSSGIPDAAQARRFIAAKRSSRSSAERRSRSASPPARRRMKNRPPVLLRSSCGQFR